MSFTPQDPQPAGSDPAQPLPGHDESAPVDRPTGQPVGPLEGTSAPDAIVQPDDKQTARIDAPSPEPPEPGVQQHAEQFEQAPAPAPGAETITGSAVRETPTGENVATTSPFEADTVLAPAETGSPHKLVAEPVDAEHANETPELRPETALDEKDKPDPAYETRPEDRHNEEPAQLWQFVDVVSGKFAGLYGVYLATLERDNDGRPVKVLIGNRDFGGTVDKVVVDYDTIRPSERTGGR